MKRAAIIGAGVIGCAIGLQLARRGWQTVNIDKNGEAGAGSTSNSCAIVRFSYSTLEGIMLAYEGHHYWLKWSEFIGIQDDRGLASFVQCGQLMLRVSPEDRAQVLDRFRSLGIRFEIWDNEQIRRHLPIMSTDSYFPPKAVTDPAFWDETKSTLAGGIFTPEAGYIPDPLLATHNLRRAVEASGGRFIFRSTVCQVERSGGRVSALQLADGSRIPADVVINAAGPYSALVNRMAGVEQDMAVRTRALRREVHYLPSPAGFDYEHRGVMTSDSDLGIYFRPNSGNQITLGSADPPCDPKTWIDDPDACNRDITEAQWNAQVFRLARRMPELSIPNQARGVVDMYDVADDWIPLYDRSSLPGFYMAIGTSGHQFKSAAAVGLLMADLIGACEAGLDHDHSPLQHRMPHTGWTLDTGAFSRLRGINRESSFSVRG